MSRATKVLISLPDDLAKRMKAALPPRKRSEIIRQLIEAEIERREKKLYDCACAVEKDSKLNKEMEDWDVTTNDGLDDDSW